VVVDRSGPLFHHAAGEAGQPQCSATHR
jgi:hypothetical protein